MYRRWYRFDAPARVQRVTMGKEIVRVIVKGQSGYVPADYAYSERLVMDSCSLSYEYKPYRRSERNPGRKWSYRTDNPSYGLLFAEVAAAVAGALHHHCESICVDVGAITLAVTYADKTRESRDFFEPSESFADVLGPIRRAIPSMEDMPAVLAI